MSPSLFSICSGTALPSLLAQSWPLIGEPVELLPGLVVAGLGLIVLLIGYIAGRRRRPRSLKEIERALRAVARGEYDAVPIVEADDPAAPIAEATIDLAQAIKERVERLDGRAMLLGGAFDELPGRAVVLLDRELTFSTASDGLRRWFGGQLPVRTGNAAGSLFTEQSWSQFLVGLTDPERRREGVTGELELERGEGCPPLRLRAAAGESTYPTEGIVLYLEEQPAAVPPDESAEAPAAVAERLERVFDGLANGVLIVADGRVLKANSTARRWLGDQVRESWLRDLVPAEELLFVLDRVQRAADGFAGDSFPCRLTAVGGAESPREFEASAIPIGFGDLPAAALTLRETGADRVVARRARLQRARLLAVMDAVADGLVVLRAPSPTDETWRVSTMNQRARQLLLPHQVVRLGLAEEQFWAVITPLFDDPHELVRFIGEAQQQPEREHAASFDLDGSSPRTVELIFRPVTGPGDGLVGRVLVVRDITHHRDIERQLRADAEALAHSRESLQKAYEQLADANKSLARKGVELSRLNQELLELDASRAELLSNVAHELQTPLVSIRGYAQMVLEGRLGRVNDEQREGLGKILRGVDRMSEMIGNLLALARAEQIPEVSAEAVDPGPIVTEVIERHKDAANARGIVFERAPIPPNLWLRAERNGLFQVLDNLVGNAVKFNRTRGRVRVRLAAGPSGFVTLEVSDNGPGIPADEQRRVFDRFYRGRGTENIPGSGIGLATVRTVVERHGGSVELESRPGEGTVVRVSWPRAPESGSSSETPTSAAAQ
ncbi:MAG: PAS domain-containing sensor histidine kinase [Acidobacteriota bacterium]|nr:MAG: PAS domain-containing sensor histidine kinase [Acidobacteriota bacterium]